MSKSKKFDFSKLEKLNSPDRAKKYNPDQIWETFNLQNSQVLVDIGAGTGFFATFFCKKMKQGKIYACDNSEIMIDWMKKNLSNFNNIIPVKSEETSIPLSSEIADLVYLINVFHELDEPEIILSEAYKLMKSGSKIAIIDWAKTESSEGPPISIRIAEDKVIEYIKNSGFLRIKKYTSIPSHYFLIAEK
jgi:ubiquinone/menaquinone biosynthesis C-methylase UbiE